jgi:acyl dehydratase
MDSRYLEDLKMGDVFVCPGVTITESEIISFGMAFDPQPFHVNALSASNSIYGGLIASGFHVISLSFRLFMQLGIFHESSMGSPGIDEVRWTMPVRPGDTLHSEVIVESVAMSRSKPDRGVAKLKFLVVNQRSEEVASYYLNLMLKSRAVLA